MTDLPASCRIIRIRQIYAPQAHLPYIQSLSRSGLLESRLRRVYLPVAGKRPYRFVSILICWVHLGLSLFGKSDLPFSYDKKGIRYSIGILLKKTIQHSDFRSRSFIFKAKQYHTLMKATISVDFISEALVICDQDPVLIKSLYDDAVVIHASGLIEHGEYVVIVVP
jgi:hypothetical protein